VDIAFKVVKKKTFSDYWNWGAFAVAMMGIVQIAIGAAIIVVSVGTATQIGGAFIGEGIGDVMYATVAGLTGTFSWKDYGIQKAISLSVTAATGLISGGISTVALKSTQIAAMTTKAATMVVVKAVAKQIALDVLKAAAGAGISQCVEKLSKLVTGEIFGMFKSNFQGWCESDPRCKDEKIKNTIEEMIDTFGEAKTTKYVTDAIADSSLLANISTIESNITGAVLSVAGNVGDELADIGDRLKYSGNAKASTFSTLAKIASITTQALSVINSLQEVVRYTPDIYDALNRRLLGIKIENDNPVDKMDDEEKKKLVEKLTKQASDAIYTKVEGIVNSTITSTAFDQLVSVGTSKLYGNTIDGLGNDMDALKNRVDASNAMEQMHSKGGQLTSEEQQQLADLQRKMREDADQYPSAYERVDPVSDPDKMVRYNGEVVSLGSVSEKIGSNGLSVLAPLSGKGEPFLVRPKYEDYIEGLTMERRANLVDLNAMAETSGINVTIQIEENGIKHTTSMKPNKEETSESGVSSINIVLLRNHKNPEGRYVLKDSNGTIMYEDEFKDMGAASAAQIMVYQKARKMGLEHADAMKKANSKDEIEAFLKDTRKTAHNSAADEESGSRYMYENADYEGANITTLPLVPDPRVTMTLMKFLKPPAPKQNVPDSLKFDMDAKSKSKNPRNKANDGPDTDTSSTGPSKEQILVRALPTDRLSNSTNVTMSNDGKTDGGGDIRVKMSKESLQDIIGEVSSTGRINRAEIPTLNSNSTEKLKRVGQIAGISVSTLSRHYHLKESQSKNQGSTQKTEETGSSANEEISLLTFKASGSTGSEMERSDSNWGNQPVRRLLIDNWVGMDHGSILRH